MGNAVTVPVAQWIGERLMSLATYTQPVDPPIYPEKEQ